MTAHDLRRVLIVDDDPDTRDILSTVLQNRSLVVDEAADAESAINLLRENRYAVVLLDLLMPGTDGFAVLDAIHEKSSSDHPVVLVVSGAERSVVNRVPAGRIHGVVKKPFDALEVASVVEACVDVRSHNALNTMALATMISTAPLLGLLKF